MNIKKQINSIRGIDEEDTKRKRVEWLKASASRQAFIQNLQKKGVRGKDYSKAMVEYDKTMVKEKIF